MMSMTKATLPVSGSCGRSMALCKDPVSEFYGLVACSFICRDTRFIIPLITLPLGPPSCLGSPCSFLAVDTAECFQRLCLLLLSQLALPS